jgi:Mg2+ and Co2+ transporter CorA
LNLWKSCPSSIPFGWTWSQPTVEEKRWIKQYYGLSIPEDAMDEDIEESARFYEEDNGELHIRSVTF